MNETLKVLETRRSCRNFDPAKMVSTEDIQAIVKAGTYAATGMGKQSPIIIAVTNKDLRDQISRENAKIMGADMGIEGNYEGIGHCAIGYAMTPANAPAPRKENYVYYVK